jgi:tetratricopeptide repeat protein 8
MRSLMCVTHDLIALVAFKLGDCQESYDYAQKALEAFPEHTDSKELLKQLKKHFTML